MNLEQFNRVFKDEGSKYYNKLNAIYSSSSCDFPIWIRRECNEMFHRDQWESVLQMSKSSSEQETAENYAKQLYHSLLKACDDRLTAVTTDLERVRVRKEICHNLQERFRDCPMKLVETLVYCRQQEQSLWNEYDSVQESKDATLHIPMDTTDVAQSSWSAFNPQPTEENLQLKIVQLKNTVDDIEIDLNKTQQIVSDYIVDATFMQDNISKIEDKNVSGWKALTQRGIEARARLVQKINDAEQRTTDLLPLLDLKIVDWKEKLKLFFLDLEKEPVIKELSQHCSDVGQKLYTMIDVCDKCDKNRIWQQDIEGEDVTEREAQMWDINRLKQDFMTKLENLIKRSCIQVKQPPHSINVSNSPHFGATIRILALEKINIHISAPIKVELLSEMKLQGKEQDKKTEFKLQNDSSFLTKKSTINEEVVAEFPSLQVREFKRPKRARKKTPTGSNNLFVCEEKFRLVFTGKFSLPPFIGEVRLRTVSLPVTLTTNSSQFSDCHAAQLWQCWSTSADNDYGPYEFPSELPWSMVEEMLNQKIEKQTHRKLPKEQLRFLADKLAGKEEGHSNYETLMVTWHRFAKEKISGTCKFSFWRWFHACVNLLQHNVNKEWIDGRIFGFISKRRAKKLLRPENPGVFLLRFSESTINESGAYITGCLTPVVISKVVTNGETKKRIEHIEAYTTKDIAMKGSLGQVLANTDGAELLYLYPDKIPFQKAFEAYNNSYKDQDDGNKTYRGRNIRFELSHLQITDNDEDESASDDDDPQYYNNDSPFSASSTINPSSVSTIMSMDPPFSPEQNPFTLPSPQAVQLQPFSPEQNPLTLPSPHAVPLQPFSPEQNPLTLPSPQAVQLQPFSPEQNPPTLPSPQAVPLQSPMPSSFPQLPQPHHRLLTQLLSDFSVPDGLETAQPTDYPQLTEDVVEQIKGILGNLPPGTLENADMFPQN